jgi:hypothetical protein
MAAAGDALDRHQAACADILASIGAGPEHWVGGLAGLPARLPRRSSP